MKLAIGGPSVAGPLEGAGPGLDIRADVFGLTFPPHGAFNVGTIELRPTDLPWYLRDEQSLARHHHATGEVSFRSSAPHWNFVWREATQTVFPVLSAIFAFAENRSIFFRNMRFQSADYDFRQKGTGRVGPVDVHPPRIGAENVPRFANHVWNRLQGSGFDDETRVLEAMMWANESIFCHASQVTRFQFMWSAIETLASNGSTGAPIPPALSPPQLASLKKGVEAWADTNRIPAGAKRQLVARLPRLTDPSMRDRLSSFLDEIGVVVDPELLGAIVRLRNRISHTPWAYPAKMEKEMFGLERILDLSVLIQLELDPLEFLAVKSNRMSPTVSRS